MAYTLIFKNQIILKKMKRQKSGSNELICRRRSDEFFNDYLSC
jgi:hypothetical protein